MALPPHPIRRVRDHRVNTPARQRLQHFEAVAVDDLDVADTCLLPAMGEPAPHGSDDGRDGRADRALRQEYAPLF